jgi:hypothetical protein
MYEDVDKRTRPLPVGTPDADSVIFYEVGLEPIDLPRATGGLGHHSLQSQPIAPHSDDTGTLASQPRPNSGPMPPPAPVTTAIRPANRASFADAANRR